MATFLNYRQVRILANPGPDGSVFRSNGEYADWDEDGEASLEAAIALKANANNAVFTGTVTIPDGALSQNDVNGLVAALAGKVNAGSPILANAILTGDTSLTGNVSIGNDAADVHTITGNVTINNALDHNGTTVGVYGATPTTKPTVTGSRGGNAALASLLTALASIGWITDSSSA